MIQETSTEVGVLRARQSYLFEQREASGAYPGTSKFHVDAIGDTIAPDVGPGLDPEAQCCDPDDPDSRVSDPGEWPGWTDGHRYHARCCPGHRPAGIPILGGVR